MWCPPFQGQPVANNSLTGGSQSSPPAVNAAGSQWNSEPISGLFSGGGADVMGLAPLDVELVDVHR